MILCEDNAVEPTTLEEAKQLPERDQWIRGARQELKKLEKRKCWKVVRIPKHRKMITSKLVFRRKRDHLGKHAAFSEFSKPQQQEQDGMSLLWRLVTRDE
jgi:hypothetical protein